jgi:myo-inositol-1(or 4)-monophosphatase
MSEDAAVERIVDELAAACSSRERAWLSCLMRAGEEASAGVRGLLGTAAGREVIGRGEGGDNTVRIDAVAEGAVVSVLDREAPEPFQLVTEEAGFRPATVPTETRVIVDPVDGSLNAKRGLEPCCAALAVADGGTLGSATVGYVRDLGRGHHYLAVRGAGFFSTRRVHSGRACESFGEGGAIELVLLEAGRPTAHSFSFGELARFGGDPAKTELRVRIIGSVALSLCHVALGAADVLVIPVPTRSVDVVAGLLMVRESGGGAAELTAEAQADSLWRQPLDLERRAPLVAWRKGLAPGPIIEEARRLVPRS